MLNWFWSIAVIDGPLPYTIWALTAAGAVVLLVRRWTARWTLRLLIAVLLGAILGVGAVLFLDVTNLLGTKTPGPTAWWAAGSFAILGIGIVSLWDSALWRRIVAIVVIVLSLLSAALGINAGFGIDRTIGNMFGVSALDSIGDLNGPTASPTATGPLYASWNPPADMPKTGKVGLLSGANAIPSSAGFVPREASLYLPPAAQVSNAPPLPLVVMMMGQPGNPDPSFIAAALDEFAAQNKGLAPIVIVADQLGDANQDPVCANSDRYGGVATYFNVDIPAYAKAKLNILHDPKYWTLAGYSNGGACSFTWGAQHPELWGNLVSISGDEYPGAEIRDQVIRDVYHGDAAAFDANTPASWLAKNAGAFRGHIAVFTGGEKDAGFLPAAQKNAQLAQGAGFTTTLYVVPGAGHLGDAVRGGLTAAFQVLYPALGLSPPS
ncbi:alpha/beta hydrolase-fold protein [Microbacterium sp. X-17]|uniref:alpha/beta hydrolase n=1 Tax=Microbacterium sp. X-17 TaxID=3144404 RepID=UPI0031F4B2C6